MSALSVGDHSGDPPSPSRASWLAQQNLSNKIIDQLDTGKLLVQRRFSKFNACPRFYSNSYKFSKQENEWQVVSYKQLNRKFMGHPLKEFKLLTYNIWFNTDENFEGKFFFFLPK